MSGRNIRFWVSGEPLSPDGLPSVMKYGDKESFSINGLCERHGLPVRIPSGGPVPPQTPFSVRSMRRKMRRFPGVFWGCLLSARGAMRAEIGSLTAGCLQICALAGFSNAQKFYCFQSYKPDDRPMTSVAVFGRLARGANSRMRERLTASASPYGWQVSGRSR